MKNTTPNTEVTHDNMPKAVGRVYDAVFLIQRELAELKQNFEPKKPTEWLTRDEVAEMLHVSLCSLWLWQKKGKLIPFGIGNRVLYKRSDIESVLIPLGKKRGEEK